jgi:hypothetical protein
MYSSLRSMISRTCQGVLSAFVPRPRRGHAKAIATSTGDQGDAEVRPPAGILWARPRSWQGRRDVLRIPAGPLPSTSRTPPVGTCPRSNETSHTPLEDLNLPFGRPQPPLWKTSTSPLEDLNLPFGRPRRGIASTWNRSQRTVNASRRTALRSVLVCSKRALIVSILYFRESAPGSVVVPTAEST